MTRVTGRPARIDKLIPGTIVELEFCGSKQLGNESHIEEAVFVRILGEGDDREAEFVSCESYTGKFYKWRAYRHRGYWAYGTSADRLKVISQKFDV